MSDLVRREDVMLRVREFIGNKLYDELMLVNDLNALPSAEPERKKGEWIPFTMRELTDEEREENPEWDWVFTCKLPADGETVLLTNGKYVWEDVFCCDDGCYFDRADDIEDYDGYAWMPLPEPYRGEE